jgi:NAD(P)-dependent dehydrogenase (short-subunit alcohol dehydrogenase family)
MGIPTSLPYLKPRGVIAFMSSHRGSIEKNVEAGLGLELYRTSKAALKIPARSIYAHIRELSHSVLSIHPGWGGTIIWTISATAGPGKGDDWHRLRYCPRTDFNKEK